MACELFAHHELHSPRVVRAAVLASDLDSSNESRISYTMEAQERRK